ncbi:MAG TPA: DDE-type integrase/transposase/recombinase [Thermoanaerobaculia bacterium]|nr:DDE-type integrase/transposase/recombinase [Thermoanaerobaculia bacterium]
MRYERDDPGELLHIDIKRLGRFDRVGHRITRQRSLGSKKQGFEFVYVAIDDASRLSYVEILADERSEAACGFLESAVTWFSRQSVRIERVMTDNGSVFVSRAFAERCKSLGVRHKAHPAVHPANERQGGAIHSDAAARSEASACAPLNCRR